MLKVHVTLSRNASDDPKLLETTVKKIEKSMGMTDINRKRLERYGILSGVVEDDKVPLIRKLADVESVELDTKRHAT